jgi:hypothetical protein
MSYSEYAQLQQRLRQLEQQRAAVEVSMSDGMREALALARQVAQRVQPRLYDVEGFHARYYAWLHENLLPAMAAEGWDDTLTRYEDDVEVMALRLYQSQLLRCLHERRRQLEAGEATDADGQTDFEVAMQRAFRRMLATYPSYPE